MRRNIWDFVLIDPISQREAVYRHISGWTFGEVLAWMEQYGIVTEFQHLRSNNYRHFTFCPYCCPLLGCNFSLRDRDKLIIPRWQGDGKAEAVDLLEL